MVEKYFLLMKITIVLNLTKQDMFHFLCHIERSGISSFVTSNESIMRETGTIQNTKWGKDTFDVSQSMFIKVATYWN